MAEPMTPATFGPMACMSRKFAGLAFWPTIWETRAAIGTAETPAEPISGLTFLPDSLHMMLPPMRPPAVEMPNATRPRKMIFRVSGFRKLEATMVASNFLKPETLKIIFLGLVAFGISTAGGLIGGNIMCKLSGKKVNPLIGSAGVSAVPMAARVSQMVGQKANPANFLLMHAMGPNVAGVIGSAIAAGFLLAVFG